MYPHLSSKWASDVCGEFKLTDFDNPTGHTVNHRPILGNRDHVPAFYDHAHFLLPLIFAYDAIQSLGWAEHTSDWDWYVGIQTRDGVWHGDYYLTHKILDNEEPEDHDHADSFEIFFNGEILKPEDMPFELTDIDYGAIKIKLTNTSRYALRDIAAVHINQR